jgi:hypothetical protein
MTWSHAIVIFAVGPFLTGCVVTGTMWKEANATRMSYPQAVGTLCGDRPSRCRAIVVRYELDTNWRMRAHPDVYVRVPMAADSQPADPFRYKGGARTAEQIESALSDTERDALRHAKLELAGSAPHQLTGFKALDPSHPDGGSSLLGSSLPPVSVLVLQRQPDRSVRRVDLQRDSPLPEGSLVVLLPSETDRPSVDCEAAKRRAALLTPLTLLADVVVTPVAFAAYILNGGG